MTGRSTRPALVLVALIALVAVVAIPAIAADPSPSTPPGRADKSPKPEKAPKADEQPIAVSGTVAATTDAEGDTTYTIRSGTTTYTLEAGPSWFWGDDHPLKAYVGKSVRVAGERQAGSTEIDVQTVDGKAVRAAGKPPWAGGWKRVGERHPGWSQAKADKFKAKFGDCFPPGQCKDKPLKPKASAAP